MMKRAAVGQLGLEVIHLLVGIELSGIGREAIDVEPGIDEREGPRTAGPRWIEPPSQSSTMGPRQVPEENRKKQATSRWVMLSRWKWQ